MSTELKLRRAPWLILLTIAGFAGLSPHAGAESPHPAPTGLVVSLPFSGPDPSPAAEPARRRLPKEKARKRKIPRTEYSSLPPNRQITDPATTGSLPRAGNLGPHRSTCFASLVATGAITLRASTPTNCLPGELRNVVADIASRFGPVSIQSTHRSTSRNRRAGGARHSLHLSCRAMDFRIKARVRGVMAYLRARPEVGGLKIYRNGIIHIDNGQRRSW